ncbi:Phage protein [Bacillus thuringiensis serovar israelensis ATCC 35646]|nr:Phage protein [Bacillus thuringiensis serovar israelensis ATCC 35646]
MIGRPFTQVTAFTNGWQDYGSFGPVAYTKDAAGFVVLQGLLRGNSGTSGSAFQLPAGFRPSTTRIFSAVNGVNGHSRIDINADGTVVMQGGAPDFCSLNGIRFLAA